MLEGFLRPPLRPSLPVYLFKRRKRTKSHSSRNVSLIVVPLSFEVHHTLRGNRGGNVNHSPINLLWALKNTVNPGEFSILGIERCIAMFRSNDHLTRISSSGCGIDIRCNPTARRVSWRKRKTRDWDKIKRNYDIRFISVLGNKGEGSSPDWNVCMNWTQRAWPFIQIDEVDFSIINVYKSQRMIVGSVERTF